MLTASVMTGDDSRSGDCISHDTGLVMTAYARDSIRDGCISDGCISDDIVSDVNVSDDCIGDDLISDDLVSDDRIGEVRVGHDCISNDNTRSSLSHQENLH